MFQSESAARRSTSEPSSSTQSQRCSTVAFGRHVANSVSSHCIVNTFVSGGSYESPAPHTAPTASVCTVIKYHVLWAMYSTSKSTLLLVLVLKSTLLFVLILKSQSGVTQNARGRRKQDESALTMEAACWREVLGELGHACAHELEQDGEVDCEHRQVVREVRLGQHALHQVHPHLERVLLVALHNNLSVCYLLSMLSAGGIL